MRENAYDKCDRKEDTIFYLGRNLYTLIRKKENGQMT